MKSSDCSHPKLVPAILMSVSGWRKSDFAANSERLVLLLSASCAGRKEPGSGPQFERGDCAVAGGKGWLLGRDPLWGRPLDTLPGVQRRVGSASVLWQCPSKEEGEHQLLWLQWAFPSVQRGIGQPGQPGAKNFEIWG